MYTVSIRSTLAVVFVAVVIAATPTQEDAEHGHATGTPSFNSVDFQQWLDNQKNRIGEAVWTLLIEMAPLLRIREKFNKQQEVATESSPTRDPNAPSPSSISSKSATVEGESDKQDKERETMEEEYTDTDDLEESKNTTDEPSPPKLKDSTKDHLPKPEVPGRKFEVTIQKTSTQLEYQPNKAAANEPGNGDNMGPGQKLRQRLRHHHHHHEHNRAQSQSMASQRGAETRIGLAPSKSSSALPHSARRHITKSSA